MGIRMLCAPVIAVAALSGCAVTKDWVATGGSKADGTVKLSYQYGLFEQPKVNDLQGIAVASQRCQSWGYGAAEAFGGTTSVCDSKDQFGSCTAWTVVKEFQCLDAPKANKQ